MDSKITTPSEDSPSSFELDFLAASRLAATGRLEEAKALLSPNGLVPPTPQSIDLLARIAVQAGDIIQARKLWQAALHSDPAYEPAKKALDSLNSSWFAQAASKRVVYLVFVTLVGCLAFVGGMALFNLVPITVSQPTSSTLDRFPSSASREATSEQAKPHESTITVNANDSAEPLQLLKEAVELHAGQIEEQIKSLQKTQGQILNEQDKMLEQVAILNTTNQALFAQQNSALEMAKQTHGELRLLSESYANDRRLLTNATVVPASLPSLNLSLDGITIHPQCGVWNICFNSALFDRDDHLKIGSKSLIESLAMALVRTQEKIHIQVVGYADNELPTWPWSKPLDDAILGQLRADRVKAILARLSLFPSNALSATNGLSDDLPHPGDSRRNRTVVLRISP